MVRLDRVLWERRSACGIAAIWTAVEFAVVPFEERRLEQRWGGAYREYRRQVPRWIGNRAV